MHVGTVVAFHEKSTNTIRHVKCHYLFNPESKRTKRCPVCSQYRANYLRRSLNRTKKVDKENTEPCHSSSHVNFRYLSIEQKDHRLHNLHQQLCLRTKTLNSLKKKISRLCITEGVQLNSSINEDLIAVMKKFSSIALSLVFC